MLKIGSEMILSKNSFWTLANEIEPRCKSTICFEIFSPIPVVLILEISMLLKDNSLSSAIFSGEAPCPLSLIATITFVSFLNKWILIVQPFRYVKQSCR